MGEPLAIVKGTLDVQPAAEAPDVTVSAARAAQAAKSRFIVLPLSRRSLSQSCAFE